MAMARAAEGLAGVHDEGGRWVDGWRRFNFMVGTCLSLKIVDSH